jgi:hypothetical protein
MSGHLDAWIRGLSIAEMRRIVVNFGIDPNAFENHFKLTRRNVNYVLVANKSSMLCKEPESRLYSKYDVH